MWGGDISSLLGLSAEHRERSVPQLITTWFSAGSSTGRAGHSGGLF